MANKKGPNGFVIALIVVVGVVLLGVGTCAVGASWLNKKVASVASDLADGGKLVMVSPEDVKTELAGPRKDLVGDWQGKGNAKLSIDAEGNTRYEKEAAGGSKEKISAPIAAFQGNDLVFKALITLTIHVSKPPHKSADHWEMTADGIDFERP